MDEMRTQEAQTSDLNSQIGQTSDYKHVIVTVSRAPGVQVRMETVITPLEFL